MSRQELRRSLRKDWDVRVATRNPGMPRKERRKLAAAYAKGDFKQIKY